MEFLIQERQNAQNGSLVYREEDYSFDVEPHSGTGFASIQVNDLQLEIDETGRVIYVWGLCPLVKYEDINEVPKNFTSNSLFALPKQPTIP